MRECVYLLLDVVERVWRVDGEADEDDVRIRVGERSQSVVILLTGSIPKSQLYMLSVDLDVRDIVLEDRWHVDLGACQLARHQETSRPQRRGAGRLGTRKLTSGNVPLEKTLQAVSERARCEHRSHRLRDHGWRT